ncbi:MAG: response regulator [Gemmatimonadaceae bacterium]|nr:response regulator [Caulobacter sp.]
MLSRTRLSVRRVERIACLREGRRAGAGCRQSDHPRPTRLPRGRHAICLKAAGSHASKRALIKRLWPIPGANPRSGSADPGNPPGQQWRRPPEVARQRHVLRLARHYRLLPAGLFPHHRRPQPQQLGQNAHLDERYAAPHLGLTPGQYVLIAVTDTGSGMPAEVIDKAFDPFFTTKEVGKGTGLGLSQVYGFVKQSGGHVKIYSEPSVGTTIKIYLPRLIGALAASEAETAPAPLAVGDSREVVLVVEDEPSVRQFSVDALGELGYLVLEADGAAAALRLIDAHPEIVLLFTDVVMPDVNDAKLAEEVRRRRPDIKILFTTGYTRNAVVHDGVLDPGVELIGKPFTLEALAAKLRLVLEAR